jgi:hypothetical protein
MGLVETKRRLVLIVEDEFLLRMAAVDMIVATGFEAVDAGEADEAFQIPESPRHIPQGFRCPIAHLRPGRSDHPEMTKARQ